MNDDVVGIGGLLGCTVLLVLYALAIGAKTKQQPSKPLKSIQPRSIRKTPTPRANYQACSRSLCQKDHQEISKSSRSAWSGIGKITCEY